jgi:hypothetical protein
MTGHGALLRQLEQEAIRLGQLRPWADMQLEPPEPVAGTDDTLYWVRMSLAESQFYTSAGGFAAELVKASVAALRIHRPVTSSGDALSEHWGSSRCRVCLQLWPCPTFSELAAPYVITKRGLPSGLLPPDKQSA